MSSVPSEAQIRTAVDRISASTQFRNSDRMIRFLKLVVERSLAGQADSLKEYLIGVEVFDRPADYDPRNDTIVRVEARRLRKKLEEYYNGGGQADPVQISMPGPGYQPLFQSTSAIPEVLPSKPASSINRYRAAAIVLILIGGSSIFWWISRPTVAPNSIAVLPVLDSSDERNLEHFGDGLMDQILDSLSSVPNLKVVARTSTMQFKSKSADIRDIGKGLGAAAVLESSVRRANGRLRITLQLIRAADGYHYWSQTFERDERDPFALQDEMARYVTSRVAPKQAQAQRHPPKNPAAYDLYVQARREWGHMPEGLPAAEKDYLKALALDQDFALAWSGLAETYSYMIEWGLGSAAEFSNKARSAADRALALDPDLAEAHTARGTIAMTVDWDWKRAEQELKRAVELRPSYAYAVHWYAHCLEYTGRVKEGFVKMQEAQALDPLLIMFDWDLGSSYIWNRQYDKALEHFARVGKEHTHDPGSAYGIGFTYYVMGQKDPGLAAGRKLAEFPEGGIMFSQGPRALAEARWGEPAEGKRQIRDLEAAITKQHVGADFMALYYLDRHDLAHAFAWFDRAVADHADGLLYLKVNPLFDPARQDPRFQVLLKRVGLE